MRLNGSYAIKKEWKIRKSNGVGLNLSNFKAMDPDFEKDLEIV